MNLINVDKPLHKRLRDPLMAAFHIKRMNALLPSVVADVDELLETMLLDAVAAHGGDAPRADLLAPRADLLAPRADLLAPRADLLAPRADLLAPRADLLAPRADLLTMLCKPLLV